MGLALRIRLIQLGPEIWLIYPKQAMVSAESGRCQAVSGLPMIMSEYGQCRVWSETSMVSTESTNKLVMRTGQELTENGMLRARVKAAVST